MDLYIHFKASIFHNIKFEVFVTICVINLQSCIFVTTFSVVLPLLTIRMSESKIIGSNIKAFRSRLGLSQDQVAEFVGVNRTLIARYESGEREVPLLQLEKFCDLFAIEIEDLFEKDSVNQTANLAFAFRSESLHQNDIESIASFQKVVKNYLKMQSISNGDE